MHKKVFFPQLLKGMLFWSIVGVLFSGSQAWADDDLFKSAFDTLYTTFTEARKVVYVTAGFGLIGFATAAIFGKISFRWLATIASALFILAIAEKIIMYATNTDTTSQMTSSFSADAGDFRLNFGNDRMDNLIDSLNANSGEDPSFKSQ